MSIKLGLTTKDFLSLAINHVKELQASFPPACNPDDFDFVGANARAEKTKQLIRRALKEMK